MEDWYEKTNNIVETLDKTLDVYRVLQDHFDLSGPTVTMKENTTKHILKSYCQIYGEWTTLFGKHLQTEHYDKLQNNFNKYKDIPEIKIFKDKINDAMGQLEEKIRTIEPHILTRHGYEIKEHNNRLLLYHDYKKAKD